LAKAKIKEILSLVILNEVKNLNGSVLTNCYI
jgi:hypothetical protein